MITYSLSKNFITTIPLPTANEAMVREAVHAALAFLPLDKIVGQPSNTSVNHLNQQVAKIAAEVKMTS